MKGEGDAPPGNYPQPPTPPQLNRWSLSALFMNVLVYPLLVLQTLIFILSAPAVLPLACIVTRRPLDSLVRYFIWVYGRLWMILMSPFVSFEKFELRPERFPQPCIIVLNHLSFFDIFCMGALPFSDIAFTIRSWPFRMFWYAPFMRLARYVDVESLGKEEALLKCSELLAQNVSLIFFPEGHRSRNGELGRFYSGAFKLAKQANTPVVPVCISGTDHLLPQGSFFMAPATIRLHALPVLNPADFPGESGHVTLRKHVKTAMAETLGAMRGENAIQSNTDHAQTRIPTRP